MNINNVNDRSVKKRSEVIDRIKKYIENNISKDISLSMLSEYTNLHPAYLSKFFKECTEQNLIDYIKQVKLEKALILLTTTKETVENIAAMTGYNTTHYFIKQFKEKYGTTPASYRKYNEARCPPPL